MIADKPLLIHICVSVRLKMQNKVGISRLSLNCEQFHKLKVCVNKCTQIHADGCLSSSQYLRDAISIACIYKSTYNTTIDGSMAVSLCQYIHIAYAYQYAYIHEYYRKPVVATLYECVKYACIA